MSEENKDLEENENEDQDNSNDWGSDDDSFGLPEIDYNPIDRESEETNEIEEESSEEPTDFNFQEPVSEVEEETTPEDQWKGRMEKNGNRTLTEKKGDTQNEIQTKRRGIGAPDTN